MRSAGKPTWTGRRGSVPPRGMSSAAGRNTYRWSPNQLRHNAATFIRKEFGLDAGPGNLLGHSSPSVDGGLCRARPRKGIGVIGAGRVEPPPLAILAEAAPVRP